jgi:hypothetical protein
MAKDALESKTIHTAISSQSFIQPRKRSSNERLPELSENVSIRIAMKKTRATPQNAIKTHFTTFAEVR